MALTNRVHSAKDKQAPLPVRDGVAPSYCWLQKGDWTTLLAFLSDRFPHIDIAVWQSRMARGEVVNQFGEPQTPSSRYQSGDCIFYYRELPTETHIPFEEAILHLDKHIVVVDKPHFLPVIPTGRFLQETLLVRLKNKLGINGISPIHRLDRETAGVIVLSVNSATRGAYQALFQQRSVIKEYEALAPNLTDYQQPFMRTSRIVAGTPFFRMQEVAGEPNSHTHIEHIKQIKNDVSLYRLKPITGRKHQLRVHLAALGIPIINDAFYPDALPCKGDDISQPLQLLARSIAFDDPITNEKRQFESARRLMLDGVD